MLRPSGRAARLLINYYLAARGLLLVLRSTYRLLAEGLQAERQATGIRRNAPLSPNASHVMQSHHNL